MATPEVCIDSVAGLRACEAASVHRIELCSALALGGLTPSAAMMQLAGRSSLTVFAMIRPRAGDFMFNRILSSMRKRCPAKRTRHQHLT